MGKKTFATAMMAGAWLMLALFCGGCGKSPEEKAVAKLEAAQKALKAIVEKHIDDRLNNTEIRRFTNREDAADATTYKMFKCSRSATSDYYAVIMEADDKDSTSIGGSAYVYLYEDGKWKLEDEYGREYFDKVLRKAAATY